MIGDRAGIDDGHLDAQPCRPDRIGRRRADQGQADSRVVFARFKRGRWRNRAREG